MAITVGEIMNRELYAARMEQPAADVLHDLISLGVSGCAVVDDENRPIAVVSLRDLSDLEEGETVEDRMTTPPLVVHESALIRDAGVLMAEAQVHRIIVIDGAKAVGIVSSLDIVRGLLGLPASHPQTFPHYDLRTGLVWTDDYPLDHGHIDAAPNGPGALLLIRGGAGKRETIIWGEATENVRERLLEYLDPGYFGPTVVTQARDRGELRFRAAPSDDPDEADAMVELLVRSEHAHVT